MNVSGIALTSVLISVGEDIGIIKVNYFYKVLFFFFLKTKNKKEKIKKKKGSPLESRVTSKFSCAGAAALSGAVVC